MLPLIQSFIDFLELVTNHISENPEAIIRLQEFDEETNDPFILVIITPLMQRVHEKVLMLFFIKKSSLRWTGFS